LSHLAVTLFQSTGDSDISLSVPASWAFDLMGKIETAVAQGLP